MFVDINKMWGFFYVDFFVLRLNFKVFIYVLWKFDFGVKYVNVFYMSWNEYYFYVFLFFSVIVVCL